MAKLKFLKGVTGLALADLAQNQAGVLNSLILTDVLSFMGFAGLTEFFLFGVMALGLVQFADAFNLTKRL